MKHRVSVFAALVLAFMTVATFALPDSSFAAGTQAVGSGEMRLFSDRLELPGVTVALNKLTGIALRGAQDLYISSEEETWLIRSGVVKCMVKYISACRLLTGNADLGV